MSRSDESHPEGILPQIFPEEAHPETSHSEELFLEQLPTIERIIHSICHRHGCFGPDAEDFGSIVKIKLMADDYAVFRKFHGKSKLATYLTVVISNQFRDFRNQQWGKWRNSASAKKLGKTARQLEALLYRDEHTLDDAVAILRNRLGDQAPSAEELYELSARLPPKMKRRFEGEEKLRDVADGEKADALLRQKERARKLEEARGALSRSIRKLEGEDRLILKMRFDDSFTATEIARQLKIPRRQIYSRLEKLIKILRAALEAEGIDGDEVGRLLQEE